MHKQFDASFSFFFFALLTTDYINYGKNCVHIKHTEFNCSTSTICNVALLNSPIKDN